MFGSDQMVWPEAIAMAIEGIESADFLTPEQKRAILYDNAARFLRLTPDQIAAHHRKP
jgi:predicted TIM-barrel fold metal-dependent hydrolase